MSNETKRDVFDELLKMYRNSMALTHEEPVILDNDGYDVFGKIEKSYAAALPDDLPTIPLAVSEEIKGSHDSLSLRDELESVDSTSDDFSVVDYIENSESVFAEAWCRGLWIVKETGEVTGYDKQ
ncbi:hypothetical protein OIU41_12000 [Lacticaseibacillus paracasei]|uniref:hypothetical protein n=1 Tax=Lacticaseibacillus paracasei TaxID=1597 RepID=UPI0033977E10